MGCGIQRAFALLFQGEFIAAFKMYPAIYTLIIFALFIFFNSFMKIRHANKIIVSLVIINVILIAGNFILKLTTNQL
ncbi:DUF2752 domain-containing protein [Sungkyunkwania multivorans]